MICDVICGTDVMFIGCDVMLIDTDVICDAILR